MKKLKFTLLTLLFPLTVNAMAVDTMLLVSDKSGNATFTLMSNQPYTEFITAQITKIEPQGAEIKRTLYDRNNIKDWEITVSNPKVILEANRNKVVGVRSLCMAECSFDSDRVYQINFIPTPYVEEGEAPKVGISIGYAPLYIIPAKSSRVNYELENRGDKIFAKNTGNTFIRLGVDQCPNDATPQEKASCRTVYTVLAGREKEFDLPPNARGEILNAVVLNHDDSYIKRHELKRK